MVALGSEASAAVFHHLSEEEVEQITWEIARIRDVEPTLMESVVEEFFHRLDANDFGSRAGVDYVREVLERAVGSEKTRQLMSRLGRRPNSRPFEALRSMDASQLFQILSGEHPQTIALVLSHLPTTAAATIISDLPSHVQADVATRIACMDATSPEVIYQIEQVIMDRFSGMEAQDMTSVGGENILVEILNQVDRSTERTIFEGLSAENTSLADAIKERMFVFEDILALDNRSIQVILREVEQEDLRLALKGVSESLRDTIYRNISARAAETLREDLELTGPVRVRDVENAQKKVMAIVRRLEDAGELVIRRTKEDELID